MYKSKKSFTFPFLCHLLVCDKFELGAERVPKEEGYVCKFMRKMYKSQWYKSIERQEIFLFKINNLISRIVMSFLSTSSFVLNCI